MEEIQPEYRVAGNGHDERHKNRGVKSNTPQRHEWPYLGFGSRGSRLIPNEFTHTRTSKLLD
jgi:hypothetical protein